MTVREMERGAVYEVESESGNTYTVRYAGSGDGDSKYVACWECSCPAGSHGRHCKHVDAVGAVVDAQDDDEN